MRGFVKSVLDGYEISGITRFQSGSLPDGDGYWKLGARKSSCRLYWRPAFREWRAWSKSLGQS